ncbi:MAG: FecR domain-containing protein [Pseudomonadales bacterium]|nr:FecR domain-containing protein [Pseudomonadales bacterium]
MKRALLILALFSFSFASFAAEVGTITVNGQASAIALSGEERSLGSGEQVFVGDTIRTGERSRVRIDLADGAVMVLLANASLSISEYVWNGSEDGSERAVFKLNGGEIEFKSGTIGDKNKDNLRIHTPKGVVKLLGSMITVEVILADDPSETPLVNLSTFEGLMSFTSNLQIPDVEFSQGGTEEELEEFMISEGDMFRVNGRLEYVENSGETPTISTDGTDNNEVIEQNFQPEVVTQTDQQETTSSDSTTEEEDEEQTTEEPTTTGLPTPPEPTPESDQGGTGDVGGGEVIGGEDTEEALADKDGDGIPASRDPDDNDADNPGNAISDPTDTDGDGVQDSLDLAPDDPANWQDLDGDGVLGPGDDPNDNDENNPSPSGGDSL